ncbi:S-adenosyl-L-methionine-dependent methyltransferase [Penicillium citrinum]|uniref:S-adenosyl-L-methionine-dependent methyltransferase n=1 Tax=Penicillium citrinum TaxID=5077 RepID=A0A9W9NLF3_PENCI|nr:S-adenosyl-L-methionine-dependent methyltransferase [Penicillium citrinum]KAJ5221981.1 S-adenosyl-L-methionine-dependent methyltransferase [Penicillium citrinum]
MTTPPPFGDRIKCLFEPAYLHLWAMSSYIRVCKETIFTKGDILAPLLQVQRLRDEAFGRFWVEFSTPPPGAVAPPPTDETGGTFTPGGNVNGSSDLIPPILRTASGIVLDIGPGTGTQMPLLRSPAIKAIYGPEPCQGLHEKLQAKVNSEGLSSKYHILPCGAASSELLPALRETGTGVVDQHDRDGTGIFDTIICVRVLCSVPEMERTVEELYALLRPGGKLLITEHVVNPWRTAKGSLLGRLAQGIYQTFGWSFFVGDCALNRDIESALLRAAKKDGGWEVVDLEKNFTWSVMPYISGTLVKRSEKP